VSHVEPLRVGRWEVEVVCEGWAALPLAEECPGQQVDWAGERERHPWAFVPGEHAWAWHVHSFVLRDEEHTLLVDAGVGAFGPWAPWRDEHPDPWAALDPSGVDHVLITHLHADHAGGSVEAGRPRFANARYHVHPADWEFFAGSDDYVAADAMIPIRELGQLVLEPEDHDVVAGVSLIHTPGHTPGHRSVLLRDGVRSLLITGDLLHIPVQVDNPTWPSGHDEDPEMGASSRVSLLTRASSGDWAIAVNHFASPFGSVTPGAWTRAGEAAPS
jgi:glyoxylase-like metal-dependent hydrolase (beta-lactamase superfamily II)